MTYRRLLERFANCPPPLKIVCYQIALAINSRIDLLSYVHWNHSLQVNEGREQLLVIADNHVLTPTPDHLNTSILTVVGLLSKHAAMKGSLGTFQHVTTSDTLAFERERWDIRFKKAPAQELYSELLGLSEAATEEAAAIRI